MGDRQIDRCGTVCESDQTDTLKGQVMAMIDIADVFQPVARSLLAAKPDWPENSVVCAEELDDVLADLPEDERSQLQEILGAADDLRLDPVELRAVTQQVVEEETARLVRLWLNKLERFRCKGGAVAPVLDDNLLPSGSELTDKDMEPFDFLTSEDVVGILHTVSGTPERDKVIEAALTYLVL